MRRESTRRESAALRIAIVHPELGLGGSERLVVQAATQLGRRGHRVVVYAAGREPERSFAATRDDSLEIRVRGRFLPVHLAQRLRAPATIARMAWLIGAVARDGLELDVVMCDLVPHVIERIRRKLRRPVVYYGHYPDLLLTPPRRGWYGLYRAPLDRLEASGLRAADAIVVNSRFTAAAFRRCFPWLDGRGLEVVHPGVDLPPAALAARSPDSPGHLLLSLGRIASDKNFALALASLGALRPRLGPDFAGVRLVIAGGFDARLRDARETLERLRALSRQLDVESQVEIRTSISESERLDLLGRARCVVHPHPAEHFGIVPVEAMAAGRPVVAVGNGGPLETILDGETGLLRPAEPEAFAGAIADLLRNTDRAAAMGIAGRRRVESHFSSEAMGARLESILTGVVAAREPELIPP